MLPRNECPLWHPEAIRVMRWKQDAGTWMNTLAEIRLSDLVAVSELRERAAGRDIVQVTLRTIPASSMIVDGTLANWWYKNDPYARERWHVDEDPYPEEEGEAEDD